MRSDTRSHTQLSHALLLFCVALACFVCQIAQAQPASPQGSQAQEQIKQLNARDSKPNLPGDPGQVGGNDLLKPRTIEQQKEEARKKSELVDLQKEAYEDAVENLLEAVDD